MRRKPNRHSRRIVGFSVILSALGALPLTAGENLWTPGGWNAPIAALAPDPADPRTIYAASGGSLIVSFDLGATWGYLPPFSGTESPDVSSLVALPGPAHVLLAGDQSGGIKRWEDGGLTSSKAGTARIAALTVDPTPAGRSNSATIYASPVGDGVGGLSRSRDGGRTWEGLGIAKQIYSLLFNGPRNQVVAGGDFQYFASFLYPDYSYPYGGGTAFSADAGATWSLGRTDVGSRVRALANTPSGDLFAGTEQGSLYRSSDGGTTWTGLADFSKTVSAIVVDKTNPGTLYVATQGLGVRRSADGGSSWEPFSAGLGDRSVTSLVMSSDGRALLAGTKSGVFEIDLAPDLPAPSQCTGAPGHLCLMGSRFDVSLTAVDPRSGLAIVGTSVPATDNFGYFSFPSLTGDPVLPEVLVKIVDARGLPGEGFWVFFGGVTNVLYSIRVNDTTTGQTRLYEGEDFCGGADTTTFPAGPASATLERARPASVPTEGAELNLLSGRFRVTLAALDPRTGDHISGVAVPQGDRSGYFSLPSLTGDATFPEVVVKMIDATSLPGGPFWVFHGSLTDVPYTLSVTDSTTGDSRFYRNWTYPSLPGFSSFCGGADTEAFAGGTR